ncbi:MAG: hypothetical protein COA90_03500 [Gammaproteobacteria bacterium]|nr:MAG: hypothetical protein COA90_03500 [Gammaproteobacteria bacterium]
MIHRSISNILVLVLMLVIAGCGFHLRGTATLPDSLKTMYVQGINMQRGFGLELKHTLKSNDINVLSAYQKEAAVLTILSNKFERRVLSVGSDAKVSEYQLHGTVTIKLTDGEHNVLIASDTLEAQRDYQFDKNQVLASDQEQALLRKELEQQLVQSILRRLSVLK